MHIAIIGELILVGFDQISFPWLYFFTIIFFIVICLPVFNISVLQHVLKWLEIQNTCNCCQPVIIFEDNMSRTFEIWPAIFLLASF